MPTEPGFFEAFYDSPWQHPVLLWLAAALGTAVALRRPGQGPRLRRYVAALGALSLLDAWLTTREVFGLGALEGWLASAVPLFFVLAGDFRFLLLLTSADAAGALRFSARGVGAAAALTAIVPVSSQLVLFTLPEAWSGARILYLVYEVFFATLTLVLLARHPGLRDAAWLRRVARFVVLYYALWATADVIILAGLDLGFAVRVVPNVLYYGGLIAMIGLCAPAGAAPGEGRS